MLQAGQLLRENTDENSPFEDYSLYMYRQSAPEFKDRVKELEQKLLHPVRRNSMENEIVFLFLCVFLLTQIAFVALLSHNLTKKLFEQFSISNVECIRNILK